MRRMLGSPRAKRSPNISPTATPVPSNPGGGRLDALDRLRHVVQASRTDRFTSEDPFGSGHHLVADQRVQAVARGDVRLDLERVADVVLQSHQLDGREVAVLVIVDEQVEIARLAGLVPRGGAEQIKRRGANRLDGACMRPQETNGLVPFASRTVSLGSGS